MLLYTQEIYIICKYVSWKMFIQLCKENNIRLDWIVNIASPHICCLCFFVFCIFLPSSSVYVCVGAVSALLFSLIKVEDKKNSRVKFKHFLIVNVIIFFILNLFKKKANQIRTWNLIYFILFCFKINSKCFEKFCNKIFTICKYVVYSLHSQLLVENDVNWYHLNIRLVDFLYKD